MLRDLKKWDKAFECVGEEKTGELGKTLWEAVKVHGFTYRRTEKFSCGGQTHWIVIVTHRKSGLDFCLIPGGTYLMGSPKNEKGRVDYEGLPSSVTVKPFLLCRTECTQTAWKKIAGSNPSMFKGKDLPVEHVSYNDCLAWCKKVGFMLPSEEEWEYACRAGTKTRFYFGEDEKKIGDYAWFAGNGAKHTHPVGTKKPNSFGLYDMSGNVWEWCRGRMIRGGGCDDPPRSCRSAFRFRLDPGLRSNVLGFRPANPLRVPRAHSRSAVPAEGPSEARPPRSSRDFPGGRVIPDSRNNRWPTVAWVAGRRPTRSGPLRAASTGGGWGEGAGSFFPGPV